MSQKRDYLNIINNFRTKRILVVGDVCLDVYLKGSSNRLCPEAPVPVVDVNERKAALGGAANTACNLRSLGADVVFCSVIGDDAEGDEVLELMREAGIHTHCVVRRGERKTITKSRVISGSQVITRIDQGTEDAIDHDTSLILARLMTEAYRTCDAIVISDYGKGVLSRIVVNRLTELRFSDEKFIAVDSKRLPYFASLHPSCVKPNYEEIIRILGQSSRADRITQVSAHARELRARLNAPMILATLDVDGALVIQEGVVTAHVPTRPIARPFVSGAGDSFISAFVLSWLASHDVQLSGEVAATAAFIAIGQESTAACSQTELRNFFNIQHKYIESVDDLDEISRAYHASGKTIVFTNGCFDILHSGHVNYLHQAKALGDVLIVGLNTDESIRRIKGETRPINMLTDRVNVLAGLSSVDHIMAFGDVQDDTPVPLIRIIRPAIFVKGGDYTKEKLPEAEIVESQGGRIILLDHVPDRSTTRIISKIKSEAPHLDPALPGLTA